MRGKKGYLERRRRCLAGLTASLAVEASGVVVTHGRRLPAVVLLFQVTERERFFLSPLVFFIFFSLFRLPVVVPFVLLVCFKKFPPWFQASRVLSFLSLYISFPTFLFSLSSLPFGLFFFPPPFLLALGLYL